MNIMQKIMQIRFNKQSGKGFLNLILLLVFMISPLSLIFTYAEGNDSVGTISGKVDSIDNGKVNILRGKIQIDLTGTNLLELSPFILSSPTNSNNQPLTKEISIADITFGGDIHLDISNTKSKKSSDPIKATQGYFKPLILPDGVKSIYHGLIENINPDEKSITIDSNIFNLKDDTVFLCMIPVGSGLAGTRCKLNDMKVGNYAELDFVLSKTGQLTTWGIRQFESIDPKFRGVGCGIQGIIEKIEGSIFTTNGGIKLDMSKSAITIQDLGENETLDKIHPGQEFQLTLMEEAKLNNNDSLFEVKSIFLPKDTLFGDDAAYINSAIITSIDLNNRTIKLFGMKLPVAENAQFYDKDNNSIEFSSFKQGTTVEATLGINKKNEVVIYSLSK